MAGYRIILKNGAVFDTDAAGNILLDGERNMRFDPASGHEWRILGFTTRHNAHRVIDLEAAASGEDIGHGWVHDMDHGTHRVWGSPAWRRAVRVERF